MEYDEQTEPDPDDIPDVQDEYWDHVDDWPDDYDDWDDFYEGEWPDEDVAFDSKRDELMQRGLPTTALFLHMPLDDEPDV